MWLECHTDLEYKNIKSAFYTAVQMYDRENIWESISDKNVSTAFEALL